MSKHLLRELLGLNKSYTGTNTNTNTNTNTETKNAKIYRTDKGRNVILPTSSLPLSSYDSYNDSYNDDLSDVSTPLLYKTLNTKFKNERELEFFSTDKNKMVRVPASNKLRIIKDLSELSTPSQEIDPDKYDNSSILSDDLSDDLSNKLRILKELSGSNSDTNSDIYSDIYSDIDLDKYDNSSILSNDLSNKSSYNSNQETSYDSFFDILKNYKDSSTPSSIDSKYNKPKSNKRTSNKRTSNSYIPSSIDSEYNIFKSSHRK